MNNPSTSRNNQDKESIFKSEIAELLNILQSRFEKNMYRHNDINWIDVIEKLTSKESKLQSLLEMERTGGEPDLIGFDSKTTEYLFVDCSIESPKGRRSLCFDNQALDNRKTFKPKNSAVNMAKEMGIEILNEKQYRDLQEIGEFDLKTSSWLSTPKDIRKLGGSIFADRRFDTVFVYHNGAESYYGSRGFRGLLRV